jgi:hypothetical protein
MVKILIPETGRDGYTNPPFAQNSNLSLRQKALFNKS